MSREKIRVAGVQLPQMIGDRQANISNAIEAVTGTPGHDIYVLPELSSSGYGPGVFQRIQDLAEDITGPSFRIFSELARKQGCYICYSFPKQTGNGQYTISVSVVDRHGNLAANYDKWHVCSTGSCCEKDYFSPGKTPLAAFDVDGIKVGLAVCYDIRFPEMARKLTLEKRISVLLHPGGWPRDEGFHTWHTFVKVRAMENSIYIMSTNWAGPDNGGTAFCPPFLDGEAHRLEKLGSNPGVLSGIVDIRYLEGVRRTYPYLTDRNIDMYSDLKH